MEKLIILSTVIQVVANDYGQIAFYFYYVYFSINMPSVSIQFIDIFTAFLKIFYQ